MKDSIIDYLNVSDLMNLSMVLLVNALDRDGYWLYRPGMTNGCNIFRFSKGIRQGATWKAIIKSQNHGY